MSLSLSERFKASRFIYGEKKALNQVSLTHRRIFILPTQRGLGFVMLICILMLIAFVYNNNLAYLLAFLLASIFFITIIHTFKSLAGLRLRYGRCQAVFAGDLAGFEIIIENPDKKPRSQLQIKSDNIVQFSLAAQQQLSVTVYSETRLRGWHDLGTVTLSSTYPLGFFQAWSPLRFKASVLVYPTPSSSEQPFPETTGVEADLLENQILKGQDDFSSINEYQPGDPVKHIHWKAYAKGLGLYSKQYSGNSGKDLWLSYQQTPGHNTEERLSLLCRWVIEAEKQGLRYGFAIADTKLEPAHGNRHYQKCLEALALF